LLQSDYDLVFAALTVAWLAQDQGSLPQRGPATVSRQRTLLLIPLFAAPLAKLTGLALGPLFILPSFAIAVRRGLAERPSANRAAGAGDISQGSPRVIGEGCFRRSIPAPFAERHRDPLEPHGV
jgi:hypothetical protein